MSTGTIVVADITGADQTVIAVPLVGCPLADTRTADIIVGTGLAVVTSHSRFDNRPGDLRDQRGTILARVRRIEVPIGAADAIDQAPERFRGVHATRGALKRVARHIGTLFRLAPVRFGAMIDPDRLLASVNSTADAVIEHWRIPDAPQQRQAPLIECTCQDVPACLIVGKVVDAVLLFVAKVERAADAVVSEAQIHHATIVDVATLVDRAEEVVLAPRVVRREQRLVARQIAEVLGTRNAIIHHRDIEDTTTDIGKDAFRFTTLVRGAEPVVGATRIVRLMAHEVVDFVAEVLRAIETIIGVPVVGDTAHLRIASLVDLAVTVIVGLAIGVVRTVDPRVRVDVTSIDGAVDAVGDGSLVLDTAGSIMPGIAWVTTLVRGTEDGVRASSVIRRVNHLARLRIACVDRAREPVVLDRSRFVNTSRDRIAASVHATRSLEAQGVDRNMHEHPGFGVAVVLRAVHVVIQFTRTVVGLHPCRG